MSALRFLGETDSFKDIAEAQVANAFSAALAAPNEFEFRQEPDWVSGTVTKEDSFDWYGYFRGYNFSSGAVVLEHRPCCLKVKVTILVHKWYNFDQNEPYFDFLEDYQLPGLGWTHLYNAMIDMLVEIDGTALDNLRRMGLAKPYNIWGAIRGTFYLDKSNNESPAEAAKAARDPANWRM